MTFKQKKFFQPPNNKSRSYLILAAFTTIFALISTSHLVHAAEIKLAWNSSEGATGYNLYCGLESRTYDDIVDVGNNLQHKLTQLSENQLYYCAVTAYNEIGESGYSDEISFKIEPNVTQNEPPTADAGEDQTADEGDTVILDGSYSSDPDDGIETYQWKQIEGKSVDLSDSSAIEPSFVAPEVGAAGDTLVFELTVTDFSGAAASDRVKIYVNDIDDPSGGVDYCESTSWNFHSLWIGSVTFGNYSNASGASSYSDFTSKVIEAERAKTYGVRLSTEPEYSMDLKYWRLWADFNQDGDFDDAGEKLLESSSNDTISQQITIPTAALKGNTRLRIAMGLFGYPNSCGTIYYGEVEDYTLFIGDN